ncbi:MAG: hypothetical protein HRT90_08890 [Candidatus Margulisbacteria bacterium]|nr:hypothetical protein [Candidatus Margulisiibacteriota bacterium]
MKKMIALSQSSKVGKHPKHLRSPKNSTHPGSPRRKRSSNPEIFSPYNSPLNSPIQRKKRNSWPPLPESPTYRRADPNSSSIACRTKKKHHQHSKHNVISQFEYGDVINLILDNPLIFCNELKKPYKCFLKKDLDLDKVLTKSDKINLRAYLENYLLIFTLDSKPQIKTSWRRKNT